MSSGGKGAAARHSQLPPLSPAPDAGEDSVMDLYSEDGLAPALSRDMALMFRLLGLESFRASVVELESMSFHTAWSINKLDGVTEEPVDQVADTTIPVAMATIAQLRQSAPEATVSRKLSPRHWAFSWRLDERHAAVAEARYQGRRDEHSDADTALVRLICDTCIRAQQLEAPDTAAPSLQPLTWPHTERRRDRRVSLILRRMALSLAVLTSLIALWTALVTVPATWVRADAMTSDLGARRKLSEASLKLNLSETLAAGDYGEVQTALNGFAALGQFQWSVVLNARQRVVAKAGPLEEVRIGEVLSDTVARDARRVDLVRAGETVGQVLVYPPNDEAAPSIGLMAMQVQVILLALSSTALALLLGQRWLKRWGSGQ